MGRLSALEEEESWGSDASEVEAEVSVVLVEILGRLSVVVAAAAVVVALAVVVVASAAATIPPAVKSDRVKTVDRRSERFSESGDGTILTRPARHVYCLSEQMVR